MQAVSPRLGLQGNCWRQDHAGRASIRSRRALIACQTSSRSPTLNPAAISGLSALEAIVQPARIPGTTVGADHQAVFGLVPGIPRDRRLAIEACRQVEIGAARPSGRRDSHRAGQRARARARTSPGRGPWRASASLRSRPRCRSPAPGSAARRRTGKRCPRPRLRRATPARQAPTFGREGGATARCSGSDTASAASAWARPAASRRRHARGSRYCRCRRPPAAPWPPRCRWRRRESSS